MAEPQEDFSRGEYFNHQDNNGNGIPDRFEAGYDPQTGLPANDTYGPQTFGPEHFADGPYSKVEQRHPMAELVATCPTPKEGMDEAERETMSNAYGEQKKVEHDASIKTEKPRQEDKPFEMGEHERRGVAGIYNNRREIPKAISIRKTLANSPKSHDRHETGTALMKDAYEGVIAGFIAGDSKKKERLSDLARATVEQAQIDEMRRLDAEAAIASGLGQRDNEADGRVRENKIDEEEKVPTDEESVKPAEETKTAGPSPVEEERDRVAANAEANEAEAPKGEKQTAEPRVDGKAPEGLENAERHVEPVAQETAAPSNDKALEPEVAKTAEGVGSIESSSKESTDKTVEPKKPSLAVDSKSPITRGEANANTALGVAASTVVPGAGPAVTAAGMKKSQDHAGTAYDITSKKNSPQVANDQTSRFKVGNPMGTDVSYKPQPRRLGPNNLEGGSSSGLAKVIQMRDSSAKAAGIPRPASKGPSGVPAFGSSIVGRPGGFGMKLAKAISTAAEKSKPAIDHMHGIKRDKSSMER